MRIWSLHPEYLDTKGLVALWRETLLAKHVLMGLTKGYTNHPQLDRFKKELLPVDLIDQYLMEVFFVAEGRAFKFDRSKINWNASRGLINVNSGQIEFEKTHLLNKLETRDLERHKILLAQESIEVHPLFTIVDGPVEVWEIISK